MCDHCEKSQIYFPYLSDLFYFRWLLYVHIILYDWVWIASCVLLVDKTPQKPPLNYCPKPFIYQCMKYFNSIGRVRSRGSRGG